MSITIIPRRLYHFSFHSSPMIAHDFVFLSSSRRPSIFTSEGIRERFYRWRFSLTNLITLLKMKLGLSNGFKMKQFTKDVTDLYFVLNEAIAKRNLETIKPYCTSLFYSKLKNELNKFDSLSTKINCTQLPVLWTFHGFHSRPSVKILSAVKFPLMGKFHEYYQVTVQFESYQSIRQIDRLSENDTFKVDPYKESWLKKILLNPSLNSTSKANVNNSKNTNSSSPLAFFKSFPFFSKANVSNRSTISSSSTSWSSSVSNKDDINNEATKYMKPILVSDYYVFERYVNEMNSPWKMAGRVEESDIYFKSSSNAK